MPDISEIDRISWELMDLLGTDRQIEPFSRRYPKFELEDAYQIVSRLALMRQARGQRPVGRKIGFTNTSTWSDFGIAAPVWNYVFDSTVKCGQTRTGLSGMPEPRIEPELILHLAKPPAPGMTSRELLECIDWVAPGFEVVFSVFPNWEFSAADAAAAYGVHGQLFVGEKLAVAPVQSHLFDQLSSFGVHLDSDLGVTRLGHARDVLGGPLEALRFLVEEINRYPDCEPLKAGEIVTTGTLTEAMPARAGETWTVRFEGIALAPLRLGFD